LKEGSYKAERKVFLNLGRIRRRLQGLAEWYGIPFREERLYSTICPRCGRKMSVLPDRRVRCACGFEAHRDEVPALWAQKRFPDLITPSFSSSSAVLRITAPAGFGLSTVRAGPFAAYRPRGAFAPPRRTARPSAGSPTGETAGKLDRQVLACKASRGRPCKGEGKKGNSNAVRGDNDNVRVGVVQAEFF
jgi:hypothetical protein